MKTIIDDIEKLPNTVGKTDVVETRVKADNKEMRDTIVELKRIIREKNLDGLTACQIGVDKRIMVLKFGENDLQSYINPMLHQAEGMILNRETCIHIPDKQFLVPRYKTITLIYETPLGQIKQARFAGKASYVVQHLMWHMDGLFIDEVGLEIDDDWDSLTDEEKTTIIKQYAESLDIASTELNEQLDSSEEGRKIKDAAEFEKAVLRGEVQIKEEKIKILDTPNEKEEIINEHNSVQQRDGCADE